MDIKENKEVKILEEASKLLVDTRVCHARAGQRIYSSEGAAGGMGDDVRSEKKMQRLVWSVISGATAATTAFAVGMLRKHNVGDKKEPLVELLVVHSNG